MRSLVIVERAKFLCKRRQTYDTGCVANITLSFIRGGEGGCMTRSLLKYLILSQFHPHLCNMHPSLVADRSNVTDLRFNADCETQDS
jgi:hypothetical protein